MNQDMETLSLEKNQDSVTALVKKTKLQDPSKLNKILRNPKFLKDHFPALTIHENQSSEGNRYNQ